MEETNKLFRAYAAFVEKYNRPPTRLLVDDALWDKIREGSPDLLDETDKDLSFMGMKVEAVLKAGFRMVLQ